MMKHQRELADWLRQTYDARGLYLEPGGKHQRLRFEVLGYPYSYLVPGGSGALEPRAFKNARAALRQLLGQPRPVEKQQPRKLEDMMPDTLEAKAVEPAPSRAAPTAWQIKIACYANNNGGTHMVWLIFTEEVRRRHPGPFTITRLDDENWRLKPGGTHHYSKYGQWWKLTYADADVPTFGSSRAEVVEVDGELLVHSPLAARRPVQKLDGFSKPAAPTSPLPPLDAAEQAVASLRPMPSSLVVNGLEDEMRDILASVRRIEALCPYRLVRLESGKILWRAPTIE